LDNTGRNADARKTPSLPLAARVSMEAILLTEDTIANDAQAAL